MVKSGDFVAELDSSNIDLQLKQQEITVNSAKSKLATEKSNYESAIEEKNEFLDPHAGVYLRDITKAQNAKAKTHTTVSQAKQFYNHSKKLNDKGYITLTQLEQDKNTYREAEMADRLANIEIELLKIGRKRKLTDLDTKIEAARVAVENAKTNLEIDTAELKKIKKMQDNCTIRVPFGANGEVIKGEIVYPDRYDHFTDRKVVMEPGTKISAKQSVALIPDPSKMQVNGKVSESKIVHVDVDQEVEIILDAQAKQKLKGKVKSVSQFVQKDRWGNSGVNNYQVIVSISDPPEIIRSGMNASIRIIIKREENVLQIPLQSMMEIDEEIYCIVKKGESWEKRKIKTGTISSDSACVLEGLEEGEQVVLNPRAFENLVEGQ